MAGKSAVVRVAIVSDNSKLNKGLKDSQSKLASFGKSVAKAGVAAGAAAAVGLALFAKSAVDAASDAQQSIGATETVFGKFSKSVIKTSNQAAEQFGLSANEYRESANIVGSLLKNQGVAMGDLAGQTKTLMGTASDLAATFGGPTSEAVDALAAAFKGEFDTLERYGISLKQSTVNTEAMRVANVKSTSEFNKLSTAQQTAAKRQATTNLIMKQSKSTVGAFARESDTLAHKQQVLSAQFDNVKVAIGNALLPAITDLTQYASDHLIPKLEDLARWLQAHQDEIRAWGEKALQAATDIGKLAVSVGEQLWPALRRIGELLLSVVRWFNDLPEPVKRLGIEAGIAAAALWKLSPAITAVGNAMSTGVTKARQLGAEMTYTETRAAAAKAGLAKLGTAARGAAGVGGMVALTEGAKTSDKAIGTLMTTLGGAATGFAVGGPVGAAVGGLAGLFLGLATHTKGAGDAAEASKTNWSGLKGTLDSVTGSVTEATKAMIYDKLQRSGTLAALQQEGISRRTAVAAVAGEVGARRQVMGVVAEEQAAYQREGQQIQALRRSRQALTAVLLDPMATTQDKLNAQTRIDTLDKEIPRLEENRKARKKNIDAITSGINATDRDVAAMRRKIAATADYTGKLRGLPKDLKTRIRTEGIEPSVKGIARLTNKYKLNPKQISTLIKATGVDTTVKDVQKVANKLKETGKTRTDTKQFGDSVRRGMQGAERDAASGGRKVGEAMKRGPQNAKVNGQPYQSSVRSAADGAKAGARSGGAGVGQALKEGTLSGVSGLTASLSGAISAAVSAAIAAGRRAARAQSPSRETERLGRDLSRGLTQGMDRERRAQQQAGRRAVLRVLEGIRKQAKAGNITGAMSSITALVKKRIDLRDAGAERRREAAIIRGLNNEKNAIIRNNKELARKNALLDKAREKLNTMRDFVNGVRDAMLAYGSAVGLGVVGEEDTSVDIQKLIDQMKDRVAASKRFAELIKSLRTQGLNRTTLDQLLQAGVEGGLATAEALASGGKAAITEINKLTNQLSATGTDLGRAMTSTFFDVGIAAQEGIVAGLVKDTANLKRAAERLAGNLVRAVKRALGIRSPSTVFEGLGDQSVKGLALGLDATYASTAGTRLADNLVRSFGNPTLSASAVYGTGGKMQVEVKLTAQQVSQLERGRAIQLDLDAYRSAGGRGATR
jgi:hypothetical protein